MNKTTEMVYWITEREAMRLRRNQLEGDSCGGLRPMSYGWSDDPHMGLVRYCNVRREDDKVTKWMDAHWRPKHQAVWEIVLARMINYIPSLQDLLGADLWEISTFSEILKERREDGEKVFTSAYTISTCGESMDKIDYVMRVVQDVQSTEKLRFQLGWPRADTLAMFHADLMQIPGLGSFLSAQVIADLKNTPGHPLQSASDWHTWAAPGPGSLRGLEAYFGRRVTVSGFAVAIAQAWEEVKPRLPGELQDIHMQDFQNCLCEFSKYIRVSQGDGRARNKYSPG